MNAMQAIDESEYYLFAEAFYNAYLNLQDDEKE